MQQSRNSCSIHMGCPYLAVFEGLQPPVFQFRDKCVYVRPVVLRRPSGSFECSAFGVFSLVGQLSLGIDDGQRLHKGLAADLAPPAIALRPTMIFYPTRGSTACVPDESS
jgi:hypothetical protein